MFCRLILRYTASPLNTPPENEPGMTTEHKFQGGKGSWFSTAQSYLQVRIWDPLLQIQLFCCNNQSVWEKMCLYLVLHTYHWNCKCNFNWRCNIGFYINIWLYEILFRHVECSIPYQNHAFHLKSFLQVKYWSSIF